MKFLYIFIKANVSVNKSVLKAFFKLFFFKFLIKNYVEFRGPRWTNPNTKINDSKFRSYTSCEKPPRWLSNEAVENVKHSTKIN